MRSEGVQGSVGGVAQPAPTETRALKSAAWPPTKVGDRGACKSKFKVKLDITALGLVLPQEGHPHTS